jgi:hypothetical protein
MQPEIKNLVKGRFLVSVVNHEGKEIFPFGKEYIDNLILDGGLNKLLQTNTSLSAASDIRASHLWRIMNTCEAGTGTTVPVVTNTALQTFVKSNSGIVTSAGACGTTYDTNTGTAIHKRTFDFSAETGTVNYSEIGVRGGSGNGISNTLWSRVVLPSPVSVGAGEFLRVAYELTQTMSILVTPKTLTLGTVNGFNGDGQLKVVGTFAKALGFVSSTGDLNCFPQISGISGVNVNYAGALFTAFNGEAPTNGIGFRTLSDTGFPTVNTDFSGTSLGHMGGASRTWSALGASDFHRDLTITIPTTIPTTTQNIRSVMIGAHNLTNSANAINSGIMWLLDSAQQKAAGHQLNITFRLSWNRA